MTWSRNMQEVIHQHINVKNVSKFKSKLSLTFKENLGDPKDIKVLISKNKNFDIVFMLTNTPGRNSLVKVLFNKHGKFYFSRAVPYNYKNKKIKYKRFINCIIKKAQIFQNLLEPWKELNL